MKIYTYLCIKKAYSSCIQDKWEGEENLWMLLVFIYLYFLTFP